MTDQTLNPPWIVRGDTVVDGDGAVVARAPADVDTQEGDARWQHHAARIAAVPLLIEACQGALHVLDDDDSDTKDALHNALVVATGEARGVRLFTLARRAEIHERGYKEARAVVKLREEDIARHSARADAAIAARDEAVAGLDVYEQRIREIADDVFGVQPADGASVVLLDAIGRQCHRERIERVAAERARDEARALLIEEQQARALAGTRAAQLEVALDLAVATLRKEVEARHEAGACADADGRQCFTHETIARLSALLPAHAAFPPSPAGASAPASGSTPGASSATASSSEAAASPSAPLGTCKSPTTAHLCEVDAILRAGRTPVYVRTLSDLAIVRACLKQRDHEVHDYGTALSAGGVFFGCADASVTIVGGAA